LTAPFRGGLFFGISLHGIEKNKNMKRDIQNYILGQWTSASDTEYDAIHAITGEHIGRVSSLGLNYDDILQYGRDKGGKSLREMTFPMRGLMLKRLALFLQEKKRDILCGLICDRSYSIGLLDRH